MAFGFLNQILNQRDPIVGLIPSALGFASNLRQQSIQQKEAATKAPLQAAQIELAQAQAQKALQPTIQGSFAQNLQGILEIAKARGLSPQQTGQLLDEFQRQSQKGGIRLGLGSGGQLTSLQIGGSGGQAGGTQGGGLNLGGQLAPTALMPNSGQSRSGSQGANRINPTTGQVESIPTRQTTGFLQQTGVGNTRLQGALKDYKKGMTPYVGINGKYDLVKDALNSALFGNQDASDRLGNYISSFKTAPILATDAARMASGGEPTDSLIKHTMNMLNPAWYSNEENFTNQINRVSNLGNSFTKEGTKALFTGIPIGKLTPEQQELALQAQNVANTVVPLSQTFFPHDAAKLEADALKHPQTLVNGQPHAPQALVQPTPQISQTQQAPAAGTVSLARVQEGARKAGISIDEAESKLNAKGIQIVG